MDHTFRIMGDIVVPILLGLLALVGTAICIVALATPAHACTQIDITNSGELSGENCEVSARIYSTLE